MNDLNKFLLYLWKRLHGQWVSDLKMGCVQVSEHSSIVLGFPKLAHHSGVTPANCLTSESSSSMWWAIFLPKTKWLESTCITMQAAIGVQPCTISCAEFSCHLHHSCLPWLHVCCSAFLSKMCSHILSVEWIVETNLPNCGHCKAPCTLLHMAHSFLQVLRSSTSFGDLVVPGNIVGVLTLLRWLSSCRMHFHHHDAILVDICDTVHIHSMQLPKQPCAAAPTDSTLPLSCSCSTRCSDPVYVYLLQSVFEKGCTVAVHAHKL